jgi:tetratricopeptide (TPR) repeat protein
VTDDGYIFDRLAYHLSLAGQATQLYQLIDKAWMVRQLRRTRSSRAFLDDVDTAIAQARAEVPPNLVQVIRGALAKASVASFTSNLPPAMLAIVARTGQVQAACDYAAFILEKARKAEAYRLIAEAMMAQGAVESIRQVLEEALLAVDQTADSGQRAQVMSELARTVARSGETQWARQLVDEALELARRAAPGQQKSSALAAIGAALVEIGDPTQALIVADELLTGARQPQQLAGYVGNVSVRAADARGLALGAYLLLEAREPDRGIKAAGEAHTAVRNILAQIDSGAAVSVLCQVARVYQRAGDPAGSSRIVDEACALARQVRAAGAVAALADAAGLYCELRVRADGLVLVDEALAAARNIADEKGRMTVLGQIASILLEAGELARAADIAMRALNASSPIEAATHRTAAFSQMAEALADIGEIRRAAIIAVQALQSARAIPDQQTKVEAWSAIGGVLARSETTEPDPAAPGIENSYEETAWVLFGMARERVRRASRDDAERAADKTLDVADLIEDPFQRLNVVNELGRVFAQAGSQETAARVFDRAVSRVADIGGELERVYALTMIVSGLAATGRTVEAARLAGQAQESAANINNPLARDRAQVAVAGALAQAGRYDEARSVMRGIQHFDNSLAAAIAVARAMSDAGEFELVDAVIKESGLDYPENWPELAEVEEPLAFSLAEKGDGESAVRCATRVHPTRREPTLHNVSIALAERKDFVRAIAVAKEIQDDGLRDEALSSITSLLVQSDQVQQALTVAEGIKTEGWKAIALARAAGHIAGGGSDQRETASALVNQARSLAQRAVEDRLKLVALVEVARSCHSLGDSRSFREILTIALSIAATGGREQVFDVLWRSAGAIAELDRGETLWAVCTNVEELEEWWKMPPTAAEAGR